MVKVQCIQKLRGNNGVITGYVLQDTNSKIVTVKPEDLKRAICEGKINVINLKLTSDKRLIDNSGTSKIQMPISKNEPKQERPTLQPETIQYGTMADRALKVMYQIEGIIKSDFTSLSDSIPAPNKAVIKMFDSCLNMLLAHNGIEDGGICDGAYETLENLEKSCKDYKYKEDLISMLTFDFGINVTDDYAGRLEIVFMSNGFKDLKTFRENIYDYFVTDICPDEDYKFKVKRDCNRLGEIQNMIEIVESKIPPEKLVAYNRKK